MGPFITFLTDFGLQDDFVGTCHGVIKRIAPDVEIIDITHGISPQGVLQGALTLANSLPFMPVGVHLAVVDPGVGGARRALALRDVDGRIHVGPDNGLLIPAAEKFGGIAEAHDVRAGDVEQARERASANAGDRHEPGDRPAEPGAAQRRLQQRSRTIAAMAESGRVRN